MSRKNSNRAGKKASGQQLVAPQLAPPSAEQVEAAKAKFEQGVLKRGEAVDAGTPLPPGATHEIIGYNADGTPMLRRKRYTLR